MQGLRRTLLAFFAVFAAIGILWYENHTPAPKEVKWADVVAEATQGGYRLISTEELYAHYRKDPQTLLLVDTRQEWEYRTGHIKGALNFSMEPTWIARWTQKGKLEKFLGPDKSRFLVFY